MLRAHRQAWCWQDEYYGLTMDDIRRLERETQVHLAEKMAAAKAAAEEGGEATPVATTPTNTATASPVKQPASEGDAVHCVEQGAVEGEGGGEKTEEVKGYNRSISRESRGSTSTIVNGGKGVRQSRSRASGEIAVSLIFGNTFFSYPTNSGCLCHQPCLCRKSRCIDYKAEQPSQAGSLCLGKYGCFDTPELATLPASTNPRTPHH